MQPIRGGPKSRGPFPGPILHNDGSTGETTRAPLYVNTPWKRWATPDIFPNIAALIVTTAYQPPAPVEPTLFKRPPPQIEQYVNVAVGRQTIQLAGTYIEPPIWKTRPPVPDVLPNIAVNLQTIQLVGKYIDPQRYPKWPSAPDTYPNIAVNLQTITPAGTYIDPARYLRPPLQPEIFPNLAVNLQTAQPAGTYIDPQVWKRSLQPDIYPNVAALVSLVAYQPPPFIEPTLWRHPLLQADIYPNIAVSVPVIVYNPPPFVEIQPVPKRGQQPDILPNIAVLVTPAATVPVQPMIDPTYTRKWTVPPDYFPNIAVRFVPPIPPPVIIQPIIHRKDRKVVLPIKRFDETMFYRQFDFISILYAGETITSASTTATLYSGIDSAPGAIISGPALVAGTVVSQLITGGVPGTVYTVTVAAATSLGETVELSGYLAVAATKMVS